MDDYEALAARYQRFLPAATDLMAQWRGLAIDGGDTVTDETGTVRVSVDQRGVPASIELMADWRQRVGTENLAAAVTEACARATISGLDSFTSAIEESGVGGRMENLIDYLSGTAPPPTWMPAAAPGPVAPPGQGVPDDRTQAPDGAWTGTAAHGAVSLTLDIIGFVSCEVDPVWLSRRETGEINSSLASALAAARSQRSAWVG